MEGVPGSVGDALKGVVVKFGDGLVGRRELGTVEVLGVDKGVVEDDVGEQA